MNRGKKKTPKKQLEAKSRKQLGAVHMVTAFGHLEACSLRLISAIIVECKMGSKEPLKSWSPLPGKLSTTKETALEMGGTLLWTILMWDHYHLSNTTFDLVKWLPHWKGSREYSIVGAREILSYRGIREFCCWAWSARCIHVHPCCS